MTDAPLPPLPPPGPLTPHQRLDVMTIGALVVVAAICAFAVGHWLATSAPNPMAWRTRLIPPTIPATSPIWWLAGFVCTASISLLAALQPRQDRWRLLIPALLLLVALPIYEAARGARAPSQLTPAHIDFSDLSMVQTLRSQTGTLDPLNNLRIVFALILVALLPAIAVVTDGATSARLRIVTRAVFIACMLGLSILAAQLGTHQMLITIVASLACAAGLLSTFNGAFGKRMRIASLALLGGTMLAIAAQHGDYEAFVWTTCTALVSWVALLLIVSRRLLGAEADPADNPRIATWSQPADRAVRTDLVGARVIRSMLFTGAAAVLLFSAARLLPTGVGARLEMAPLAPAMFGQYELGNLILSIGAVAGAVLALVAVARKSTPFLLPLISAGLLMCAPAVASVEATLDGRPGVTMFLMPALASGLAILTAAGAICWWVHRDSQFSRPIVAVGGALVMAAALARHISAAVPISQLDTQIQFALVAFGAGCLISQTAWFRGPAVGVPAALTGLFSVAFTFMTLAVGGNVIDHPSNGDGTGVLLGTAWLAGLGLLVLGGFVAMIHGFEQRRRLALPAFSTGATQLIDRDDDGDGDNGMRASRGSGAPQSDSAII